MVAEVSQERIAATMKRLESFGSRHVLSEQSSPDHGIGAAQHWIVDELKSYSPRLEVSVDSFSVKKTPRIVHDAELTNIVAVLPGKIEKDRYVVISAHYDSLAMVRKPGMTAQDLNSTDWEASAAAKNAPGVVDDGSGVAAVMETARILSQYEFDKSIMFIAFSGEEMGLIGSRDYAEKARKKKLNIEAVLNNDIIGTDLSGNGNSANHVLHVFSADPNDSSSRALARYFKETAERYVPGMKAELVFRQDRFARNGDHSSFLDQGFCAVRLTTPAEFFAHQHTTQDTFANASVPYTTLAVRMNAAVLASLALAPKPPVVTREITREGTKRVVANLTRGKSGYDAVLKWTQPSPEPDLAGYAVVMRSTTSPVWEREIYVGDVKEYTISDLSIDNVVLGVKAIDKDGNQSLVSAYVQGNLSEAAQ
jgi:acetylornithine deacetylase/succinyl-diaminopimelate desuccinylase-like protein